MSARLVASQEAQCLGPCRRVVQSRPNLVPCLRHKTCIMDEAAYCPFDILKDLSIFV